MSAEFEILKIVLDAAKHVQSVYINNVWATMGSYLVAFGWLLTSKEARGYLIKHKKLLRSSALVSVGIFVIHALVLISAFLESNALIEQITNIQIPTQSTSTENIASLYAIPWYWPVVSLIINGSIAALLFQKLWTLEGEENA